MDGQTDLLSEVESVSEDEEVFELGAVSSETKGGWIGSATEGAGGSYWFT